MSNLDELLDEVFKVGSNSKVLTNPLIRNSKTGEWDFLSNIDNLNEWNPELCKTLKGLLK